MEKILLAIDAINPDTSDLDFACYSGRLTKSRVVGLFLENLVSEERQVLKKVQGVTYMNSELNEPSAGFPDKRQLIEWNVEMFKQAVKAGVSVAKYTTGVALPSVQ